MWQLKWTRLYATIDRELVFCLLGHLDFSNVEGDLSESQSGEIDPLDEVGLDFVQHWLQKGHQSGARVATFFSQRAYFLQRMGS